MTKPVFKGLLIKVNQKSWTKDFGLGSSVTCGKGVRHPTAPIQRIVPYFNLIQTLSFGEEIGYLAFWFLKKICKLYIYIYIFIYLRITYHGNINVKEHLQSKHVGYIHKYQVRKHANREIVYNSMWVEYLLDKYHVSTKYYTNKSQHKNKKRELEG